MRTATPLVTCSRITLRPSSATSWAISTPRFMGPGCMITTSSLARARRSFVTPKWMAYSRRLGRRFASWRSFWMRRTLTTSTPSRASSTRQVQVTPIFSTSRGVRVLGPAIRTLAPDLTSPQMLERATRLCFTSPMMATVRPSRVPFTRRMVNMSSSPWVGCSCWPSPAFTTEASTLRAMKCGAPLAPWRTTMKSTIMDSMFRTVSLSVSPLTTLDMEVEKERESAERRFSASSKEIRVRVEGS